MKTIVIIPTYKEIENLQTLIPILLKLDAVFDILIVDDSSPDGTAAFVEDWIVKTEGKNKKVHLLLRAQKQGLGKAYLAGFSWALQNGYNYVVEMDADFSHRPHDLVRILEVLPQFDFVVGSRYVPGGATLNWGWIRKLISRGGSLYSRLILGFPLKDWTGGFNAWKVQTLKKMNLESIQSNGYSFQIELKYKALKAGCVGHEVPILFEDRRVGQSKMSFKIIIEAFYRVWLIRS